MKYIKLIVLIPFILLASCKGNNSTTEQNTVAKTLNSADNQSKLNESEVAIDSAKIVLTHFAELVKDKKYEEALHFYRDKKNYGYFFSYFKTTTESYEFHEDIVFSLMYEYLPEEQAIIEVIESLEILQTMTELVLELGKRQKGYVPPQYDQILGELGQMYVTAKMWDKAFEQANKVKEYEEYTYGKDSYGYATGLFNEAYAYGEKGDKQKALSIMYQAKLYYEKAIASGKQDRYSDRLSEALQNTINLISEWETE